VFGEALLGFSGGVHSAAASELISSIAAPVLVRQLGAPRTPEDEN